MLQPDTEDMERIALSLLGPTDLNVDGQPLGAAAYARVRALLIYLAVEAPHPQPRDVLAALLWPDHPMSQARTNLRQALTTLRSVIGDRQATAPALSATRAAIQIDAACVSSDVATFGSLLAASQAHRHPAIEHCTTCIAQLEQASALYRGDFLQDFTLDDCQPFEEWRTLRREALHQAALDTLARLADAYERRGAFEDARRIVLRLLMLEPWHEEAHRQLMLLHYQAGRRSAALAQFARCRDLLARDLGIEPAQETRALYSAIRSQRLLQPARSSADKPADTAHLLLRQRAVAGAEADEPAASHQHEALAESFLALPTGSQARTQWPPCTRRFSPRRRGSSELSGGVVRPSCTSRTRAPARAERGDHSAALPASNRPRTAQQRTIRRLRRVIILLSLVLIGLLSLLAYAYQQRASTAPRPEA